MAIRINPYVKTLGAAGLAVGIMINAVDGEGAPDWAGDTARVFAATVSSTATEANGFGPIYIQSAITGQEYELIRPSNGRSLITSLPRFTDVSGGQAFRPWGGHST